MIRDRYLFVIVLISFVWCINGEDLDSDFFNGESVSNGSHVFNCTIDGEIHYDDDCLNWLAKFIRWLGLGMFLIIFLFCGCFWYCICTVCRVICCSERPREVIYTTYVYPTTYNQIP